MAKLQQEDRFSILKEDGLFSLVIYPEKNKTKLNLLFAWLMAWTICGVIFIFSYFNYSHAASMMRELWVRTQLEVSDKKLREETLKKYENDIEKNEKQRMFLLVIIAFWCYYEFKVGRAYSYRKFGREKIWIKNGVLFMQKQLRGRGKVKKYDLVHIRELRQTEYNQHDFFQNVSRSFWTLSGDALMFEFHSKGIRFGLQLEEKDAAQILDELKKALKKGLALQKENKE